MDGSSYPRLKEAEEPSAPNKRFKLKTFFLN
jgi:hypothetical protein